MKKTLLILTLAAISAGSVSAGAIRDEYFKTRDDLEKAKDTPESRKMFLETNIQRSLRQLQVH